MSGKSEGNKKRKIDESIEKTIRVVEKRYQIVPSMEVKAWKAYLIITFAAGFCAALIWASYMSIYPRSKATETAQVTLSLSVSSQTHKSGEEFPVDILLNTASKNIVAVQVIFSYNPGDLQLVNIDTSGSDFSYEVKNSVDSALGQGFVAVAKPHLGVSSDKAKIAKVNFKALKDVAEPAIQLKFDSSEAVTDSAAILDDSKGTNVLQRVLNGAEVETQNAFKISSIVGLADTVVKINWSDGPIADSDFAIERKEGKKDFAKIAEVGSEERAYVDRSARPSKLYAYRVCQQSGTGEKTCTDGSRVKTMKKKRIFKPRLVAMIENGKVKLTWSPTYTSDFSVFVQKRIGKQKKFTRLSVINSDSVNLYLDESVTSGQKLKYQILVAAKKKNTQKSKSIGIAVP